MWRNGPRHGDDSTWNHQKAHFARTRKKSEALQSEERMQSLWQTYNALCETFTSQGLTHPADIPLVVINYKVAADTQYISIIPRETVSFRL